MDVKTGIVRLREEHVNDIEVTIIFQSGTW